MLGAKFGEREGLSDGGSLPRTVKRLLDGFDPVGRLLLFCGRASDPGCVRILGARLSSAASACRGGPGRNRGTGLRGVALGDTQVVDGRGLLGSDFCVRMSGVGHEESSMMDQAG